MSWIITINTRLNFSSLASECLPGFPLLSHSPLVPAFWRGHLHCLTWSQRFHPLFDKWHLCSGSPLIIFVRFLREAHKALIAVFILLVMYMKTQFLVFKVLRASNICLLGASPSFLSFPLRNLLKAPRIPQCWWLWEAASWKHSQTDCFISLRCECSGLKWRHCILFHHKDETLTPSILGFKKLKAFLWILVHFSSCYSVLWFSLSKLICKHRILH